MNAGLRDAAAMGADCKNVRSPRLSVKELTDPQTAAIAYKIANAKGKHTPLSNRTNPCTNPAISRRGARKNARCGGSAAFFRPPVGMDGVDLVSLRPCFSSAT